MLKRNDTARICGLFAVSAVMVCGGLGLLIAGVIALIRSTS